MQQAVEPQNLLDLQRVLAFSRGNLARAQALVQQFLAVLLEEKVVIENAYAAHDLDTVRQSVHRLNSGGQYTGFVRVSAAAQILEQLIIDGVSDDDIASAFEGLNREIQTTLDLPKERLLGLLAEVDSQ